MVPLTTGGIALIFLSVTVFVCVPLCVCVCVSVCMCVCVSDKQRAELTQQHTEWSRQMTQRHMQQIEDLQAELQTHTQMMALQQVTHRHPEKPPHRGVSHIGVSHIGVCLFMCVDRKSVV